jgi:hypothetical protein
MGKKEFENFIIKVLDAVEDFCKGNGTYITFQMPFEKPSIYTKGITKTLLNEEMLYYIEGASTSAYIRFIERIKSNFTITTDNGSSSITFNEDLEVMENKNYNNLIESINYFDGTFEKN